MIQGIGMGEGSTVAAGLDLDGHERWSQAKIASERLKASSLSHDTLVTCIHRHRGD